jgi:hypothetical protein
VGQTRSRALVKRLALLGFGELLAPPALPPPYHLPFALDNGAFAAWQQGKPWDPSWLLETLGYLRATGFRPDFVVCPDIVTGGAGSLAFSLAWASRPELAGWPLYLAVQDGMAEADVVSLLAPFAGIFVGGSLDWKIRTGAAWVRLAHSQGLPCHIGRVGTEDRAAWARRIGADSIDSSLPLFSEDNLNRFLRGLLEDRPQGELFP